MNTKRVAVLAAVVGLAITLTACGSDDKTASGTASTGNSASARTSGGPGGGNQQQFAAIQACLKAAGLGDKVPSGLPSGRPSGEPPSGFPTNGTPPSGFPSDGASGGPGGPGGGFGQIFSDPDVQAALKACGIDLPSAPARQG